MKRLGLFGGTFNPIHLGHLRAAEEVRESLGLDKLLFIPSHSPPHKEKDSVAPAHDRLEMVRLSIAGYSGLGVSDFEALRETPSFTIETLRHFQDAYPNTERTFILGLDAFLEIHTWREFPAHFHLAHFVVVSRPGPGNAQEMDAYVQERLSNVFKNRKERYVTIEGKTLFYFMCTGLDISGSMVREAVRSGKSARFLVHDKALKYIMQTGIYRR